MGTGSTEQRRTTLDDVSRAAGVSKSTASRALARPSLVAPETVRRVDAAATELGFVASRTARALARGRAGIAAIVVPTLENAFFMPVIQGAQLRAARAGMPLTITVNGLESERDLAELTQLAEQVDGFLLTAPRGSDGIISRAVALKPSILIDRQVTDLPSVSADTATAFAALAQGLLQRGHERLVLLGGPDRSWQNVQRTAAVRSAVEAMGASLDVLGPFAPTFASGVAATPAVIDTKATAVVCYAAAISLGLIVGLGKRGIVVPDDITVTSDLGVVEALELRDAPTLDVEGAALGDRAMERLLRAIEGDDPEPRQETLPVRVTWSRA